MPGAQRGRLLSKLADLIERDIDEFAALESLNTGTTFRAYLNIRINVTFILDRKAVHRV